MFWQWIAAIKMSFSFRTTLTTHLLPKNLSQQCKISNENVQIYMISAGLLYGSVHKTNRINYLYTWSYVLTMDCSNQNVFSFIIIRTTHLLPKNWLHDAKFHRKTFIYWWFPPDYNTESCMKYIELAICLPDCICWQWIAAIKMSFCSIITR